MHKKVGLQESKESSTYVFGWKSIKELNMGNLNLEDVGLATCKQFVMMLKPWQEGDSPNNMCKFPNITKG
jgi:hypothetical protein